MSGMQGLNFQNLEAFFQQQQQPKKNLVEFKAGILTQTGTTVTADERRGKVVLTHSSDGLLHLQWKLRTGDKAEFDLELFPKSATWEKVSECKDGRVYLLQFKASSANRRFFWIQEAKDDKDDEFSKKINELIENPQAPMAGMGADPMSMFAQTQGAQGARPQTSPAALSSFQQPSTPAPAPATTTTAASTTASTTAPASSDASAMAARLTAMAQQMQAQQEVQSQYDLENVVDADRVMPALEAKDLSELMEFLPEGQRTPYHFEQTLRSPQLKQALQRVSGILNSAQYAALLASLGLPVTGSPGVPAFLGAIQDEVKKEEEAKGKE